MGEANQPAACASDRETINKWKAIVAEYQKPNVYRASWQLLNSVGAYVGLWVLMYLTRLYAAPWWLTIALALLAGTLLVRVFIIFHDCGHGSFVKSRKVNNVLGFITGLLTFTPYYHWRWEHS
ncbi:MAG: fatty acid desaturase, partial [Opitutales bacterium]